MSEIQRINSTPIQNTAMLEEYKKHLANRQSQIQQTKQDEFQRQTPVTQPQRQQSPQNIRLQLVGSNEQDKYARLKSNLAYAVSVGSGLAIIAMLIYSMTKGAPKEQVKQQLNEIVGTSLNWVDMNGKGKKVAPLTSETTSKVLKDAFIKIKKAIGLTDAQKAYSGAEDFTNMVYLYGHGGVGKTYVAEQFAQEMNAIFTCIKYPDLASPFKDASTMKVEYIFDEIIAYSKLNPERNIVVCIDEIDTLIRKINEMSRDVNDLSKIRGSVLTSIDKLTKNCPNVTLIATSNYPPRTGLIDEIVLRRFNNLIEVPLPDLTQTKALLKMYMKKTGAINEEFYSSREFNDFAKKLVDEGYSNGEIELICTNTRNNFGATLHEVKDADLPNYKFDISFLEEAKKYKGEPASKTNYLMRINAEG